MSKKSPSVCHPLVSRGIEYYEDTSFKDSHNITGTYGRGSVNQSDDSIELKLRPPCYSQMLLHVANWFVIARHVGENNASSRLSGYPNIAFSSLEIQNSKYP